MTDLLLRLHQAARMRGERCIFSEAADEIERLRKIETAARALRFGVYPAHGNGFVTTVIGGNIDDLRFALGWEGTEMIRPGLAVD